MPNLIALSLMVSDKKNFKDLKKKISFVSMATRVFEGRNSRNSEEDHCRNISVKFHQNLIEVNGPMDGHTTGHNISLLAYGQWS